jgi:hypothetical protein
MADKINDSRTIGQVQPASRTRDTGRRKKAPRQLPKSPSESPKPSADDGTPNRVDEYA